MKTHYLLLAACLAAVGCTESGPIDRVQVLSPGRAMRLAYRFETHYGNAWVEENRQAALPDAATQPSLVTKRVKTPREYVEWGDGELSLHVAPARYSDNLRVTMTVQRFRLGRSHEERDENKEVEILSFKRGHTTAPASPQEDEFEGIRDVEFIAVVDPNGRIASADASALSAIN